MCDWSAAVDANDTMVRAIQLNYRKVFDLIDRHILLEKCAKFTLPTFIISRTFHMIISWVGAFCTTEASWCVWATMSLNGCQCMEAYTQGICMGPTAFLLMTNDLLEDERRINLVDDTRTQELCHVSGSDSKLQSIADDTTGWSLNNGMQ